MMRWLLCPILIFFLAACSAQTDQGHVVYVQIGDSTRLKVDLEKKRVKPLAEPAQTFSQAKVLAVPHNNEIDDLWVPVLEGCNRSQANWKAIPIQKDSIGSTTVEQDGLVITRGTLLDVRRRLYLSGICPAVITLAVTSGDVLLIARAEVTEIYTMRLGKYIESKFIPPLERGDYRLSRKIIISRTDSRGGAPTDVFLSKEMATVRALSLDPVTGDVLAILEVATKHRFWPWDWLMAGAGHPRYTYRYDLVAIDKSARVQKIIELGPERERDSSEMTVKILY